jgi:hypothetical protein
MDRNNWAPRLGFAWQASSRLVVRGGYGIFYEQIGAANNDVNQQGFSQRTTLVPSLDNGLTFQATLANPFPSGFIQPAGSSAGLGTFIGRAPGFFTPNLRSGYMQRWSFGGQYELPWRSLIELSYVGNRGTKLGVGRDWDAVPGQWYSTSPVRDDARINFLTQNFPNPFAGMPEFAGTNLQGANIARQQLLKPYPHFSSVSTTDDIGYSWYHSLQARYEKRYQRGVTLGWSYTFAKFMEAVELLNPFDARPTEVVSPQDRPHHFSLTGIYELPWMKQNRWIGGWQMQAIYQYMTGPPVNFGNVIWTGSSLSNLFIPSGQRKPERWFNIDAGFERDSARQLAWNVRAFPLRLSGLRSDGFDQWDISAFKNFRVTEKIRFQLRGEAQNALNKALFAAPNNAPANTLFGQVTATQFAEARRITLAGKLTF